MAADSPSTLLGRLSVGSNGWPFCRCDNSPALAEVSSPHLSLVECGLYEPSVRVLQWIAGALNVSAQTLFEHVYQHRKA